jgi:hypothetical protein
VSLQVLERLAAASIRIVPALDLTRHFLLERNGVVALVERSGDGFGKPGAPGLLTERGFAALVWRGDEAWFIAKGLEQPAKPEQVAELRRFADDLRQALGT